MTDQPTALRYHEDGYDADGYPPGYGGESALDESLDELDDWDGSYLPAARRPQPPRDSRPLYRDPRWLFLLIALAAAALVVATVLLVTGRGSGEIPTAPGLGTRTPANTTSAPSPSGAPPSPSQSAESASASSSSTPASPTSSPSSTTPASEEPAAVDVPEQQQPTASAAEPPPPPAASQNRSPSGPRINVTRTPMSFSPGKN
jgi:hypothetical protein